ncbi:MAG: FAD-dependent oxidoreductase [Pseudomonadota bacterium]
MQSKEQAWDEQTDLLVIGSGAGGSTAALVAALEGLAVILCEKTALIGGTSATSGGAIWIAGSSQAARAGYQDTRERGQEYLRNELGSHARHELLDAYIDTGPSMVDYLEQKSELVFDAIAMPDYHPDTPGGMAAGRVLMAKPFDGRTLGQDFKFLAPPLKRLMALGGMMVPSSDIPMMLQPFKSYQAFSVVTRSIFRYAMDRLRYPRGTRLVNGNALIGRLFSSLRKAKADIRLNTSLVELISKDGRVEGAVVETAMGRRRIRARRGVVLATGGAAQSSALQKDLMKNFPHNHTVAHHGSTGDGLQAALKAGAVIDRTVSTPAVWTPASVMKEKDGTTTVFPYGYLDRGKPGAIAVNATGRRFVNEANSYHDVVQAMYAYTPPGEVPRAHLICDSYFLKRYGLGIVRPRANDLRSYLEAGYLVEAQSLQELAGKIGVDGTQLTESIGRHNDFAKTGVDSEFAKGTTAFNWFNGDPTVKPNPNLKAIEVAPFYALPITPATLSVSIGLKTNENAQVLNGEDQLIEGLYACGNDMASVMRGLCPGGGVILGPAMVFGYRAALHAAGQSAREID